MEIVYVACTWMKSCQDEEEGKKVVIKNEIVNSTLALFYLQTNPQVCHICNERNLPNSFLEIMRPISWKHVFRIRSYTFLNECCRAFEKNHFSVRNSLTLLIINIFWATVEEKCIDIVIAGMRRELST